MFGIFGNKNKPAFDLKVVFHKDANGLPEHGTIYADHRQQNLRNEPVRFSFGEIDKVPVMTPALLEFVFDEAQKQGYVTHCLRSYANIFTVKPGPALEFFDTKSQSPDGRPPRTGVARTLRRPSGARAAQAAHAS